MAPIPNIIQIDQKQNTNGVKLKLRKHPSHAIVNIIILIQQKVFSNVSSRRN